MSATVRQALFIASALIFALTLLAAMEGLPRFGSYRGPYGDLITGSVLPVRHTFQSVASVTFDFRGFDTLGEEFILFTSVAGVTLLFRRAKQEREERPRDVAFGRKLPEFYDLVRAIGILFLPFAAIFGVSIIFHGHITPGGGFQGGDFLASALCLIYLSGGYSDFRAFIPSPLMEMLEAAGAAGFVLLGAAGLLLGGGFLENVLPLGKAGRLLSAGTLPVLNLLVGTEVCAGFLLIATAFLKQAVMIRKKRDRRKRK